jgi:UDP-glucose:(heptosyl)LPS alpha-1,3-glucosyltransferase
LRLALFLFTYQPYGGLQRDFLAIAGACSDAGLEVDVYTGSWSGAKPEGLSVRLLSAHGFSNHARNRSLHHGFERASQTEIYDAKVGFDRVPGLDVYYAADPCFAEKAGQQRGWVYRLTPRYRQYIAYERAIFSTASTTDILLLTEEQMNHFRRHYQTQPSRCHLLPPGIDPGRRAPPNGAQIRTDFRSEFGLTDNDQVLLMVASQFKTKGLDRALKALAAVRAQGSSKTWLYVLGPDDASHYHRLIKRLGLSAQVRFFSGRDDVRRFMIGADALIHPSRVDSAGNVILEAIVAGLPALVTANCGYAHYVTKADAGLVLTPPFDQRALNEATVAILESARRSIWSDNGIAFGRTADIYSRPQKAVEIIAERARQNRRVRAEQSKYKPA